MPDGRTVAEIALPQVADAYAGGGRGIALLPGTTIDGQVIK